MKKIFVFMFLSVSLFAHSLVMNLYDNNDNTITVVGEFSTGESATGALIILESLVSGDVLFQQRLPKESELTINIPKEPYQVVLDGGVGHTIVKDGIAPKEGFSEELKAKVDDVNKKLSKHEIKDDWTWHWTINIFFSLCLILFALAIYFGFYNTNRILKEVRKEENRE